MKNSGLAVVILGINVLAFLQFEREREWFSYRITLYAQSKLGEGEELLLIFTHWRNSLENIPLLDLDNTKSLETLLREDRCVP